MRPHVEIVVDAVLLKAHARLYLRQEMHQDIRVLLQHPRRVLAHNNPGKLAEQLVFLGVLKAADIGADSVPRPVLDDVLALGAVAYRLEYPGRVGREAPRHVVPGFSYGPAVLLYAAGLVLADGDDPRREPRHAFPAGKLRRVLRDPKLLLLLFLLFLYRLRRRAQRRPPSERVDKPGAWAVRHRVHRESTAEKVGFQVLGVHHAVAYHLAAVGGYLDYHADYGHQYLAALHSLVGDTVIPEREQNVVYSGVRHYIVVLRVVPEKQLPDALADYICVIA